MGIFSEQTRIDSLIKIARLINTNYEKEGEVLEYLSKLQKGKINNDFIDDDILEACIKSYLNAKDSTVSFDELKETIKFMLPYAEETEDFESIKSMILRSSDLIVYDKDLVNTKLYMLFNDKILYTQFMRILKRTGILENKIIYRNLVDYACNIAPLCMNSSEFSNELISYVNDIQKELGSLDEAKLKDYNVKRLVEIKKRRGIYPLDETTLLEISSVLDRVQRIYSTLEDIEIRVRDYEERISLMTARGIEKIDNEAANKIRKLASDIEEVKADLIKRVDDYVLVLKQAMKKTSDEVLAKVLEEASETLNKIKVQAKEITVISNNDLVRMKKQKDEIVEEIKSSPELRNMLTEEDLSSKLKEVLKGVKNGDISNAPVANSEVIIPSTPYIIVPEEKIDYTILKAFDESIPYSERIGMIKDEMTTRQRNGERFQKKTLEIAGALIEGDWPYVYGPSGMGKSYCIEQAAELLGMKSIDNGKITDKYSIMAYNDPHGRFRVTPTYNAVAFGKLLTLDEFDNGNTDSFIIYNNIYSNLLSTLETGKARYITFGENVQTRVHPNFRMISAGNTDGEGENEAYSDRHKIDESVIERMVPIYFDYDNEVEKTILGDYKAWYDIIVKFRSACMAYSNSTGVYAKGIITTRDASLISKYIRHNSKTVDEVLSQKFVQIKDEAYLNAIAQELRKYYGLTDSRIIDLDMSNTRLDSIKDPKAIAKKLICKCEGRHNARW